MNLLKNEWVVAGLASLGVMLLVKHVSFLHNIFA